jgi:pimeloyl-ACP methyl ester carboxylesterase
MTTESLTHVDLPNGRMLEVRTAGPEDGEIFLFHHGTPGAGLPFAPMADAAAARGLRTVMYSRPGYGASTPQPGRRVVDAAADSARVVEAVAGPATFRTLGWSGGGPHALACAAALPDRCLSAVSVAGLAPYPSEGIDWFDGMAPENVEEFGLATRGADALAPFLEAFAASLSGLRPEDLAEGLGGLLSEVDKMHVTGDLAAWMLESMRIGLAHGIAGQRDDDLAFAVDWGFDLRDARSVAIWQGAHDCMVPYAHGIWLADHIPGARRRLLAGEGHLSMAVGLFEEILDDVLAG